MMLTIVECAGSASPNAATAESSPHRTKSVVLRTEPVMSAPPEEVPPLLALPRASRNKIRRGGYHLDGCHPPDWDVSSGRCSCSRGLCPCRVPPAQPGPA